MLLNQITPVIFLYFCSKRSERIFVLKNIRALSIIVYLIVANCLLHTLFPQYICSLQKKSLPSRTPPTTWAPPRKYVRSMQPIL